MKLIEDLHRASHIAEVQWHHTIPNHRIVGASAVDMARVTNAAEALRALEERMQREAAEILSGQGMDGWYVSLNIITARARV